MCAVNQARVSPNRATAHHFFGCLGAMGAMGDEAEFRDREYGCTNEYNQDDAINEHQFVGGLGLWQR